VKVTRSSQPAFKDHFSVAARGYSQHRPGYPPELFAWLARVAPGHAVAWDCATGNGQAALGLAEHFERVVASDASTEQIANRRPHERVDYLVALAEASALRPASCDLISVAQSAHWFDFERFYPEVRRVARPGGVLALWTYSLFAIEATIDDLLGRFYRDVVGAYWPPERRFVEQHYRTLPFPIEELEAPVFELATDWNLDQVLRYLGTWSAVSRFRQQRGFDPVAELAPALAELWGEPERLRHVAWPLHLRAGRM
jgi:SAM-dependent methyltransferase